jgi:small-conductance mechanosensitive channel
MYERRVVSTIGVTYDTPNTKLAHISKMVKQVVVEQENARFDRVHFSEFGDFSLNFEYVYYVLSPDYNTYMDIQEGINQGLHRLFAEEGIEFAYPTQTLFIEKAAA